MGDRIELPILGAITGFDHVLHRVEQGAVIVFGENEEDALGSVVRACFWVEADLADALVDEAHLVAFLAPQPLHDRHMRCTDYGNEIALQRNGDLLNCMLGAGPALVRCCHCICP